MIHRIGNKDYYIGIVSHKRPDNVSKMEELLGHTATWHVGAGEEKAYKKEGVAVVEAGRLIASRNSVLESGWSQGVTSIMLDDDITKFEKMVASKGKKKLELIDFDTAVKEMELALSCTPFKLAGTSMMSNTFWIDMRRPVSYKSKLAGVMMVRPCDLLFDKGLEFDGVTEKEDTDYCLQHLQKYGGLCKLNHVMSRNMMRMWDSKKGDYAPNSQTGGLQKSVKVAKLTYDYMMKKWGSAIRTARPSQGDYQVVLT